MDNADLHAVQFIWYALSSHTASLLMRYRPDTRPRDVILTGTFDQWSASIHLVKGDTGFHGTVKLPWGKKIAYKFIVDDHWQCLSDKPTEDDGNGNINNILYVPQKPLSSQTGASPVVVAPTIISGLMSVNGGSHGTKGNTSRLSVSRMPPGGLPSLDEPSPAGDGPVKFFDRAANSDLSSITDTLKAGTSAAIEYATSGLGALVHGATTITAKGGPDQTADLQEDIADKKSPSPPPLVEQPMTSTAAVEPVQSAPKDEEGTTPANGVAPVVPIVILPVNDPESNGYPIPQKETQSTDKETSPLDRVDGPSTHTPAKLPDVEPKTTASLSAEDLDPNASQIVNDEIPAPVETAPPQSDQPRDSELPASERVSADPVTTPEATIPATTSISESSATRLPSDATHSRHKSLSAMFKRSTSTTTRSMQSTGTSTKKRLSLIERLKAAFHKDKAGKSKP
ncbi:hypothetical protein ID866_1197 [Astraeus odoratus]|nr:hypothetical protein ID866_1197 [Astraeus odoratus]